MKANKRRKLEAAGWKVGSVADFLQLSDTESMLVNMKVALAKNARELRREKHLSQSDLAKRLGSSQSRIAKLEAADQSVSLELMVKSLVTLGATRAEIGRILGEGSASKAKKRVVKKRLTKA